MSNKFLGIFLLLVLVTVNQSWAQLTQRELKVDSLLHVVAHYPNQDTVKSDLLAQVAISYNILSNYPMAVEYWLKVLDIVKPLKDQSRIVRAWGSIGVCYTAMANYPKALEYHQKALLLSEREHFSSAISYNLNSIGRAYMFLGDYAKAIEYYERALEISKASGYTIAMAKQLRNIGNTYCKMENYQQALPFLQQSQQLFESLGNNDGESIGLGIIGTVYYHLADYENALAYHQRALELNRKLGNKRQESMNLLNIGKDYREMPDEGLEKLGINLHERYPKTLAYLNLGRQLSNEIKDPGTEKDAWNDLSFTYEKMGAYAKAFDAYKKYIQLRDSVEGNEIKNKMATQELQFNFDKKEAKLLFDQQLTFEKLQQQELLMCQQRQDLDFKQQQLVLSRQEKDLQHLAFLKTQSELREQKAAGEKQRALTAQKDAELKLVNKEKALQEVQLELTTNELVARENQRNAFIVGSVLLMFFAGAVVLGLQRTSREKRKSEALLLNILPSEVANELKQNGEAVAKQYNHVSVLFTDFVNFTGISEQLSPTELVAVIHKNFTAFDAIIEKHGLEKIKTIGDAYLAVCGLPNETKDHAQRAVRAALDIQEYMKRHEAKFDIRIGIHSGPVVAGIVGVKKYAYDIWGDTVNVASRMESNSEAGKVNISGVTYRHIRDEFACKYRGKIQAKNKGEVDMYFVEQVV
jgi:adenylate cyclase